MTGSGLHRLVAYIREPARKQKIYIFLVCLFCSAVFWLFIRLSQESQADIRQLIRVVDLPPATMLVEQSDQVVLFSVQTTGARLFGSLLSSRTDTLRVPFSALSRTSRDQDDRFFISSSGVIGLLSQHVDAGVSITNVRPDTIFVNVSARMEKRVPVVARVKLDFERRFGLYGNLQLLPDSVVVAGPKSMVDTITAINTRSLELRGLNHSVTKNIDVLLPSVTPALQIVPEQVSLHVPVEEFTEAQLEIPLDIICPDTISQPFSGQLRLFPPRVQLVFQVALRDYHKIESGLFSAYVKCPRPDFQGSQLPVNIGVVPDFVRMESVRPSSVDYLIIH